MQYSFLAVVTIKIIIIIDIYSCTCVCVCVSEKIIVQVLSSEWRVDCSVG